MKKWLIGIIIVLVIAGSLTYLLIPNIISFNHSVSFPANHQGLYRVLMNEGNWAAWWPGSSVVKKEDSLHHDYTYNGYNYAVNARKTTSVIINVDNAAINAITVLQLFPLKPDTVRLSWAGSMATSYNPFERINIFIKSKKLEKDISDLLVKMQTFYADSRNIYGAEIKQVAVVDSTLISNYAVSSRYPGTAFIYALIDELKVYIAGHSAKETGIPMLNITTKDSTEYLVKVAIPVDKKLASSGNISYRWMLGGGNILTSEVRGGPWSIQNALHQMETYMNDHRRIGVAIPFQSLVTDRRNEPDTSNWVTKLYYPVI